MLACTHPGQKGFTGWRNTDKVSKLHARGVYIAQKFTSIVHSALLAEPRGSVAPLTCERWLSGWRAGLLLRVACSTNRSPVHQLGCRPAFSPLRRLRSSTLAWAAPHWPGAHHAEAPAHTCRTCRMSRFAHDRLLLHEHGGFQQRGPRPQHHVPAHSVTHCHWVAQNACCTSSLSWAKPMWGGTLASAFCLTMRGMPARSERNTSSGSCPLDAVSVGKNV